MKIKLFFICSMLCFIHAAQAQLKLGVKVGISSSTIKTDQLDITNLQSFNDLGINVKNATYGPHFGVIFRYNFDKLHIQPEILLNTNKIDYSLKDLTKPNSIDSIRTDKMQFLDIPILLGYDFGLIRIHGGPVAHILLAHTTTLTDIQGYKEDFSKLTLGYQAGVGLDLWKLNLDLRYEGNFTKFGDHFTFVGKEYKFSQAPGRVMLSLGFMF